MAMSSVSVMTNALLLNRWKTGARWHLPMPVLFNKPYGVLSQFTSDGGRWQTLAGSSISLTSMPPAALDADSEGCCYSPITAPCEPPLRHRARANLGLRWKAWRVRPAWRSSRAVA